MYGKMKKMKGGGKKPSEQTKKNMKPAGTGSSRQGPVVPRKRSKVGRNAMLQIGRKGGIRGAEIKDEQAKKEYVPQSQRNNNSYVPQSQRGKYDPPKKMRGKKKMYREGGTNNASYSYQDFLDL